MNRVAHLLHKMSFLLRQRRTITYSKRYLISDKDVKLAKKKGKYAKPTPT